MANRSRPKSFARFYIIAAVVGFIALAYMSNQQNNKVGVIIYLILATLFQPFFKISLGREIWNVVDVIVAIGLIVSLFVKPGIEKD